MVEAGYEILSKAFRRNLYIISMGRALNEKVVGAIKENMLTSRAEQV